MSNDLTAVATLAVITSTHDGTPIGVIKTRLLQTEGVPTIALADGFEASDIDAYVNAPVDGHHGVTCTVIMQHTADWKIPDEIWLAHYTLLCMSVQVAAMTRHKVTCEAFNQELGELPTKPGMVGVAMCIPSYTRPSDTTMNGKPFAQELSRAKETTVERMNRNDRP